jgi:SAM-dependent methyltransferase
MKKVFRYECNSDYWDRRWEETDRDSDVFDDLSIYPIYFAEMVMRGEGRTAELGCGLGRVLKHYKHQGKEICGIEKSKIAVKKLKEENSQLDVQLGNVLNLPFGNDLFDTVMAFGVYHNLETGIDKALQETRRVLKEGGQFCISMRPDNFEMQLNEYYWSWKNRKIKKGSKRFHKTLVGEQEFLKLLSSAGLQTEQTFKARNVSILYRVSFLRNSEITDDNETFRRSNGYKLNIVGRWIDSIFQNVFSYHSSNILVFIGRAV